MLIPDTLAVRGRLLVPGPGTVHALSQFDGASRVVQPDADQGVDTACDCADLDVEDVTSDCGGR
ncbi:MAG: hypothetical protein JO020_30215 [Chloroflexi bacterium]|nr:hypothetical protein [Chloroflexota bacterium]